MDAKKPDLPFTRWKWGKLSCVHMQNCFELASLVKIAWNQSPKKRLNSTPADIRLVSDELCGLPLILD